MYALVLLALSLAMTGMIASGVDGGEAAGTDNSDKINGSNHNDTITAGAGADLLVGYDGDDQIHGEAGHDWIFGFSGTDLLDGGDDNDVLVGGDGADTILGGAGNDFIESADIVDETALMDSLEHANRFDEIVFKYDIQNGDDAGDFVDAGDGNDTIIIGSDDTVISGAGADDLHLGDWVDNSAPAIILDFNTDEDTLNILVSEKLDRPDITIENDPDTQSANVILNGVTIAVLEHLKQPLSLDDIIVSSYS